MATRVFRCNPGEHMDATATMGGVTEAVGAATTKVVEITVDLSATAVGGVRAITRDETLNAINDMVEYITRVQWPPA